MKSRKTKDSLKEDKTNRPPDKKKTKNNKNVKPIRRDTRLDKTCDEYWET